MKRHAFSSSLLACIVAACGSDPVTPAPTPPDTSDYERAPHSCAYDCPNTTCSETSTPYACPSMGSWASIPHDASCGGWNGQYPAVKPGQCTATAPTGDAIAYAGTTGNVTLLPDGRKLAPAGADWVFAEKDATGGLTTNVLAVPNTNYVLAVDTGYGPHVVRVVDSSKIGGGGDPTVSRVTFALPKTLNSGIAFIAPDLVYVATDNGVVQALKLDTATGALAQDDARSIQLPPTKDGNGKPANWYVSGVAASSDGKRLVVTSVTESQLFVYDVAAGSMTFGQQLGGVGLGGAETFGVYIDPSDQKGDFAYVSMWEKSKVLEVDLSTPSAPKVRRTFPTKKDPEGIAFLDARTMVACGDLGDALTIIDRASGSSIDVPMDPKATLYGSEPGAATYDASHHRLYVTLGGSNALAAYDVDTTKSPPGLTPLGHIPAGFWPSAVTTLADGTIVVANMRGRGTGARPLYFDLGDSDIADRMRGSIQRIPFPSASDITAYDKVVTDGVSMSTRAGVPEVQCPNGANDFPLPATNAAPSPVIQHVFVVVRENKAFDGIYGDFPGANGEPKYVLKPNAMDQIWLNLRAAARQFAISDNYYTDAIYSTQGHVWTTYGRSNDFNERTWLLSDGHSARAVPGGGVIDVGQPTEGSLFDWLGNNGVPYDIRGEIDGSPAHPPVGHSPLDGKYPGGPFQNIGYNDLEKACYLAGEMRVFCNLGNVTYLTLPNDHTFGVSPKNPTPETFCAINDEATGMFLDALSHSPLWASSVAFITEDDPSQGGEHVDSHRTPFTIVSPWVKRGYVSKTHIDVASLHKMIAHFVGKPYPNALVERAALPFDLFTSTPDYTPYKYQPHAWPIACGGGATKDETTLTDSWDFSREDAQPGLDAQVERWMAGRQMTEMPASVRARLESRLEAQSWR